MKIQARLNIPGSIFWVHPGTEVPQGFAMRGQDIMKMDLLYNGRVIGRLGQWPRANRIDDIEVGGENSFSYVTDTDLECTIDMDAWVEAVVQ